MYVQCYGTLQGWLTPFANDGYNLTTTEGSTDFSSPLTNEPYSKIPGDFNPIHTNPYFSDCTFLPETITCDMWLSAATRKYIETVVVQGRRDRVLA